MSIRFAIAVSLSLVASDALAAVTVSEQIMQSGQFVKADCQPDPKDPEYNECICDADIRYPQISGLHDAAIQDQINGWYREEASKAMCEGEKTAAQDKPEQSPAHASLSMHYEQTFSSPQVIAFKFTEWAYTGGAHGNGSVLGTIVDLPTGKFLAPTDLFSAGNMPKVNKAIYDALNAKPEEEIFRDQIESRQGLFIKNGECEGCTLTLTPDGVHVLFQTYEVAPYGAGNTDVPIPEGLVSNPDVTKALNEPPSPDLPEKK